MEGKFSFHDNESSKTKDYYYLEPGLCHSFTNIVEAMSSLIQIRNNHNTTCIGVKKDPRNQKVAFLLVNDESSLVLSSIDLEHIFERTVLNNREFLMPGKGPHKPLFADDFVRFQSLMIWFLEYNIVGEAKAPYMLSFHIKGKVR